MTLKSKENRQSVREFLDEALRCHVNSPVGVSFERMRLFDGILFNVSDDLREKQASALERLVSALGPVRGHASDVEPIMWQAVVTALRSGRETFSAAEVDQVLDDVEATSGQKVRILKACKNVVLLPKTNKISIGPVSIRRSEKSLTEFRRLCPHSKVEVSDIDYVETEGVDVTLPPFVWDVEMTAASKVREEHAGWLIDIAISLLRMGVKSKDLGMNPPTVGKLESSPFIRVSGDHDRLIIGPGSKYSVGGWTMPKFYQLGVSAQRQLMRSAFREKAGLIFEANTKTLGERVGQGLGWLSRGRQSADRSTRLLYFFTAIESLLSDSDKSSPIVQTVARHAAVLLNNDNVSRASISRTVRQLYGLRSSLVHTGKRGVVDRDSNTIQYIAELLFQRVFDDIDLSMKHQGFVEKLSDASYGFAPNF